MMTQQCNRCEHLKRNADHLVCDAFPKGIPEKILVGDHDHTDPFPDDNGIRFEPVEEEK